MKGYHDNSDAQDSIVLADGPSWISKYLGTAIGKALLIDFLKNLITSQPLHDMEPLNPSPALYTCVCLYMHVPIHV